MTPSEIQIVGTVCTLLIVVLGAAVQWGSQKTFTESLDEKIEGLRNDQNQKHGEIRSDLIDHKKYTSQGVGEVWKKLDNHEGRIGYLEGKANGQAHSAHG